MQPTKSKHASHTPSSSSSTTTDDIMLLDLENSLQLLLLAIRLDERDEQLLEAPLEVGNLLSQRQRTPTRHLIDSSIDHDNNADRQHTKKKSINNHYFYDWKELILLLKQYEMAEFPDDNSTTIASWWQIFWWRRQRRGRLILPPLPPGVALTPILLSGLVAAVIEKDRREYDIQENPDQHPQPIEQPPSKTQPQQGSSNQSNFLSASDLVVWCNAMRRSAVKRLKARKRRHRFFRIASFVLSVLLLNAVCYWTYQDYIQMLGHLGYLQGTNSSYGKALVYRWAEANLWMTMQDYLAQQIHSIRSCTILHCSTQTTLQAARAKVDEDGPYFSILGPNRISLPWRS